MSRLDFLYRRDLTHRAVSVYVYLADHANKDGECWPAIPTIAKELKLSQSTVRRALHACERKDCWKPSSDTDPKAAKAVCSISSGVNKKRTFRQGGTMPSWWKVVPVMVTGERELPNLRVLQQKRNSEGFLPFFPPFFKNFFRLPTRFGRYGWGQKSENLYNNTNKVGVYDILSLRRDH